MAQLTLGEIFKILIKFLQYPLVESLIGFLIGLLFAGIIEKIKNKRPYRRIWGLKDTDNIYIINGTIILKEPPVSYMHFGDINALASILSSLKIVYPKLNPQRFLSDHFPDPLREHTIITIGGPIWNHITRHALEKLNWPFNFTSDVKIIDKKTGKKYDSIRDAEGELKKDYAFFMKGVNPINPTKDIYIIAGITTSGVLAAARLVSKIDGFSDMPVKNITKLIRGSKYFALLIETDVLGQHVAHPKLIASYKLTKDELLNLPDLSEKK